MYTTLWTEVTMPAENLAIDRESWAEVCRCDHVRRLSLFDQITGMRHKLVHEGKATISREVAALLDWPNVGRRWFLPENREFRA